MNKSKTTLFLSVIIIGLLVTACGGAMAGSWPGLTVNQDTAYVAYASAVYSIKLSDGTLAWKYPAQASAAQSFYAPPVLTPDGKQLLVGDYGTTLTSLDPVNGNMVWSFKDAKGRWVGSPLVTEDTIYAPNADNSLYALDFQGKQKWKFTTKGSLWARPVTDGKVIYQASMDHYLYAIQPQDGKQVWATNLAAAIVVSPLLDLNGILYVGSIGDEILAVQASSGKILWRTTTTGAVWSQVVLQDGTLYVSDLSGAIYAITADTGKILWQQNPGGVIAGSLAVIPNGLVYGNDAGVLAAIDFKGNPLWPKTFSGKLYTSPVFQSDRIYIAITGSTDSSLLVALDTSGNQKWSFVPPK
jgi:outer membrane protein assembly factor BamB